MTRSVQIRNVPDLIHRTLRSRAAGAGMSLSEYLLAEIVRLAERPPVADVFARAAARHGGAEPESVVESVRAGRDRS
jgi:plasmid stability protein